MPQSVALQTGNALGPRASAYVASLLKQVVRTVHSDATDSECTSDLFDLCITVGNTNLARQMVGIPLGIDSLGPEAFGVGVNGSGGLVLSAYGNPYMNSSSSNTPVNGALYGAFAVLEILGYGFLHPLQPLIPSVLDVERAESSDWFASKPTHRLRMWHYHTEHPLELTDVLQGFNASTQINVMSAAPRTADGHAVPSPPYFESWDSMLPQLNSFFAWLVANRQNHFEWVMLLDGAWESYGTSDERKARFSTMVRMAHDWGLFVGADAPLVMVQQHAWHMADGGAAVEIQEQ